MRRLALACLLLCPAALAAAGAEALALRQRYREVAQHLRQAYVFVGGGSGVIVSADGLVLSNYHVTGEQEEWQLQLADGSRHRAVLVGMDPVGDLALLRLDGREDWHHLELGAAADLRIGTPVLAIGNPFGLGSTNHEPTLTRGTLGGVRLVRDHYSDCLQFDAPVNPGNSGGPLVDGDGALLGINGQIRTRSGLRANSGIGLAIGCTQIADFLPLLAAAAGGYVHHAAAPAGLAWEQRDDGVFLTAVPEGCPDLAVGDRLLAVNGRPVASAVGCTGLFEALPWRTGGTHALGLLRNGVECRATVPTGRTPIPGRPWHGLKLRARQGTARIILVEDGSPAARAGIARGEVLEAVDGRPIASQIDFLKALVGKEPGDAIACRVRPGGEDAETREVTLLLRRR